MAVILSGKLQFNQHSGSSISFFLPNLTINQSLKFYTSLLDALPGRSIRNWSNPNTDQQRKNADQSPTRTGTRSKERNYLLARFLVEMWSVRENRHPSRLSVKNKVKHCDSAPAQHSTSTSQGDIQGNKRQLKTCQFVIVYLFRILWVKLRPGMEVFLTARTAASTSREVKKQENSPSIQRIWKNSKTV